MSPDMFHRSCTAAGLVAAALLSFASGAAGQASFVETFDAVGSAPGGSAGPAGLEAQGWIFRNQSEPLGSSGWYGGSFLSPFEGSGYLEASGMSTDFFGGDVSLWAILPVVPGQIAGDDVLLHVQRVASHSTDRIELRYAPGGGTDTGSGAHDVGDFSTVLLDETLSAGGWQTLSATVPGAGRLAIRFAIENACNFGCATSLIGLDLLSVGPAPGPGCNLPPLPAPGETVHWTAAGGPWELCADVSIPATSTVIVEAGAQVAIEPGRRLYVSGTLRADGTAAQPVSITGGGNMFSPAVSIPGEAELHFVQSSAYVQAAHGGTLLAYDSQFTSSGLGSDDAVGGQDRGTYLHVERCAISGVDLMATDATLALIDTTFTGGGVQLLRGYLYVDGVSVDGSSLTVIRERYTQPAFLGGLSITGSPVAALTLQGWDFYIADDTVLSGNLLPVQLTGGILPGSAVPSTGNVQNHVDTGDGGLVGSSTWGALDVPYVVGDGGQVGGASLQIEAGTTVAFRPNAALIYYASAGVRARGRPEAPIHFRAHVPGTTWNRWKFQSNTGRTHFEHAVFEDAQVALQSDNSVLFVDDCTFRDNLAGTWTNTGGLMQVRKSRFLDNLVGAHEESGDMDLDGSTNPNVLSGNALAVEGGNGDATDNWWGHPSGPSHPSNPGGAGDAATAAVQVLPFLSAPPDADDPAPIVTITSHGGLADTGSKVLLRWEVEEDSLVTEQRILYSPHGNWNYTTLVDGLDGQQRSHEWTVPLAELSNLLEPAHLRVVAVDDAGQEGWDEVAYTIPYTEDLPPVTFDWLTDLSSGFTYGDEIDLCWQQTGMSATWNLSIWIDGDGASVPYGGATTLIDCWTVAMPYVSTDRARFALRFNLGAAGRARWFFSEPFSIRPDPRLPDAPPTVSLTAPVPGTVFSGGDVVPVAWTASDDEALREVRLLASYDAGRTWRGVAELPGSAAAYAWALPGSSGIDDVRLRVVAVDRRFQHSSDEVAFDIAAGGPALCQEDIGLGGPGSMALSMCGDALATGGVADLVLAQGPSSSLAWLFVSDQLTPTPFFGGQLGPVPVLATIVLPTDAAGGFALGVPGGQGPITVHLQAAAADGGLPGGVAISNALRVELLP